MTDQISKSILFFTGANVAYEHFVPLYIFFTLKNNKNAEIEICLEDYENFAITNKDCINFLEQLFPNKFLIRTTKKFSHVSPNSVRFVETPLKGKYDYVYIGDIDILILDKDIALTHIKHINTNNIPFSNVIRANTNSKIPHLSGLHFAPWNVQYPIPDISDLPLDTMNDEQLLYTIMLRKNIMIPESANYRPVHGIHISPNRHPLGRKFKSGNVHPGWGITNEYCKLFIEITQDDDFQRLYYKLSIKARNYLTVIDNIAHENYSNFSNFAKHHIVIEDTPQFSDRIMTKTENLSYLQRLKQRSKKHRDYLLSNKMYNLALQFQYSLLSIFFDDAEIWHQLAWQLLSLKKFDRAIIAEKKALTINPDNLTFLNQLLLIYKLQNNKLAIEEIQNLITKKLDK